MSPPQRRAPAWLLLLAAAVGLSGGRCATIRRVPPPITGITRPQLPLRLCRMRSWCCIMVGTVPPNPERGRSPCAGGIYPWLQDCLDRASEKIRGNGLGDRERGGRWARHTAFPTTPLPTTSPHLMCGSPSMPRVQPRSAIIFITADALNVYKRRRGSPNFHARLPTARATTMASAPADRCPSLLYAPVEVRSITKWCFLICGT